MGTGRSGLKRLSSGGSTTSANTPINEEKYPLTAYTRDGERIKVEISIQDTSALDNIENLDYTRGSGRFREANAYRVLLSEANRNAKDDSRPDFMQEPSAKKGRLTATDSVPVMASRNINGSSVRVLEKTSGYVTNIDGDNIYIQKNQNGVRGYKLNIAGMVAKNYSTLGEAKADIVKTVRKLKTENRSAYDSALGTFKFLNKNNGRVSNKIMRIADYRDFVSLGQK